MKIKTFSSPKDFFKTISINLNSYIFPFKFLKIKFEKGIPIVLLIFPIKFDNNSVIGFEISDFDYKL
jgi:hypothetical protein